MPLLDKNGSDNLRKDFADMLSNNIKILLFGSTKEYACLYCKEIEELLSEVAEHSEKISLEKYDFDKDIEKAEKYKIKGTPAIVVEGNKDYGIRFYGIPAGHEFKTLINLILYVSSENVPLSDKTKEKLREIDNPINIQVFVTPSCSHCPPAANLAISLAIANDNITTDIVEIQEFPQAAERYEVFSVPKTVINEENDLVGAVPEHIFLEKIMETYRASKK